MVISDALSVVIMLFATVAAALALYVLGMIIWTAVRDRKKSWGKDED